MTMASAAKFAAEDPLSSCRASIPWLREGPVSVRADSGHSLQAQTHLEILPKRPFRYEQGSYLVLPCCIGQTFRKSVSRGMEREPVSSAGSGL